MVHSGLFTYCTYQSLETPPISPRQISHLLVSSQDYPETVRSTVPFQEDNMQDSFPVAARVRASINIRSRITESRSGNFLPCFPTTLETWHASRPFRLDSTLYDIQIRQINEAMCSSVVEIVFRVSTSRQVAVSDQRQAHAIRPTIHPTSLATSLATSQLKAQARQDAQPVTPIDLSIPSLSYAA